MIFLCACHTVAEPTSHWKELIPLASPVVVILLFIIDRFIGYNLRKKETDRSWYFKVLIEPGIDKITTFYKNTNNYYTEAAHSLEASKESKHTEFSALKGKEFFKFQELKRELEAEIIQPIMSRYQFIGNSLTDVLLNLEDTFTGSLDEEKFSEEEIKKFHLLVFANRAVLLNQLYSPLQPRPNIFLCFWGWIKNLFSKKK